MKSAQFRIGVDLGGTKTEVILTRADNPLDVISKQRVPTSQEQGYRHIVQQMADLINPLQSQCGEKPLVGIGIPGSMSPTSGLVRNANTQCLIGQPLKTDLEGLIDNQVTIENDANCFALSEALLGAGRGKRVVMGIILGTGMGGGLVIEGQLWRGLHGNAGEWGHSSIDWQGPLCWCGQRGCLELYLSGTGIQRLYQSHSGRQRSLPEIYGDYEKGNDSFAHQTIIEMLEFYGRGMANLITSIDPDVIVLGGGVSNLPILYTLGYESVKHHLFNDVLKTPILQNQLGDSSGIFGAAMLSDK